jgi:hypothetical protein
MQASSPAIQPNIEYPPPPRVHWFILLLAWFALAILIAWQVPTRWQNLANSLVVDAWVFNLCLWIRSLDQDARSPFWCDVYLIVELSCAAMSSRQTPSNLYDSITGILVLASAVLGIVTIFLIRADLLKHYNQREPIGLELSGMMTWFFSFLYFQARLYPIAQARKRRSAGIL